MKIRDLYQNSIERLQVAKIPDAQLEVSILLCHLLKISRAELFLNEKVLLPKMLDEFEELLLRRLQREPISYILGEHEFWSLPFKVTPDVLIPRPETEILIEIVLQIVKNSEEDYHGAILDIGTGSGAIAIALARELPAATVFSLDLSYSALQIAAYNVKHLQTQNRVHLLQSDLLQGIRDQPLFDLIVSNPPYVSENEFAVLQPELAFEPRLALDGGSMGMETIERLAVQIWPVLKPGGWFFMEIGAEQSELVKNAFSTWSFENCSVYKDYAGLPRIFQARKISD
ncbi:MAG: peptide chain release factor N(5)-glutamine methyltransferase [Desulfobulbaceae bacterium]|nr:peptide chain release factor N(5)-glutamine methyltransferase [Desulfobulbaceae bacterium]